MLKNLLITFGLITSLFNISLANANEIINQQYQNDLANIQSWDESWKNTISANRQDLINQLTNSRDQFQTMIGQNKDNLLSQLDGYYNQRIQHINDVKGDLIKLTEIYANQIRDYRIQANNQVMAKKDGYNIQLTKANQLLSNVFNEQTLNQLNISTDLNQNYNLNQIKNVQTAGSLEELNKIIGVVNNQINTL